MRILLTGSGGFTGRQFSFAAKLAGHEIVDLKCDLTDATALADEVLATKPEAVVHLAGIAFVGHAHEEAFYAVNVVGTTNLLDALSRLPMRPRIVLLASSANVYGNCEQSPIAETQEPAPVNHYAMSKLAMEQMARTYMDRLHIVIARPFNYTGPGQDEAFVIPKLAKHFALRLPSISLGNLNVEREFNDVRTVCQAYLTLLNAGKPGEIYNVCSGKAYKLQTVIDTFTRLTGHQIHVEIDPAYVRANEVHSLYGSFEKLRSLAASYGQTLQNLTLDATLQSLLSDMARKTSLNRPGF